MGGWEIFTSLSIKKLRRVAILEIMRSIGLRVVISLSFVRVRALCELSLELELYLVLSIAADAASFRVGRNSQDDTTTDHRPTD